MKNLTQAAVLGALCTVLGSGLADYTAAAEAPINKTDPLQRPALITPRAAHSVMLAVAAAGSRMVAAGERGIVLWSDDGKDWRQAKVPVSVTLTALSFPEPQAGWAVGHAGVILHSTDGGQSWTSQLDGRAAAQIELKAAQASGDANRVALAEQLVSDGPDKPFLAVHFWDAKRGFVVGAFGLIFGTEDGGVTWTSWFDRIQNAKALHLNALYVAGESVFLVGEQGLILRSTDNARSFQALESPYKGSWFAVAGAGGTVVVAGLRGNAFRSTDLGASWTSLQVPVPVTIGSAVATKDGMLVFANQAGMLMGSTDGGQTLHPIPLRAGPPLTALAAVPSGLLAASFAGPVQLPSAGQPASRP